MRSGGLCLKPFQHYPRVFRSVLMRTPSEKLNERRPFPNARSAALCWPVPWPPLKKIIGNHETLTLSDQDRDRLFAALLDPPPPNRALRSAFADHSNEVVAHGDA